MSVILKFQRGIAEKVQATRSILDAAQAEDRPTTAEERAKIDGLKADIERISEMKREAEAQEELEARMAASVKQADSAPLLDDKPKESRSLHRVEVRDAADNNLAMKFGLWLQEARDAAYGRGIGGRLEASLRETRAASGMNAATPADGGFLVTTDVSKEIFRRMYDLGEVVSRVKKLPPLSGGADSIEIPAINETSRATGSRAGGVQGYWISEATAPTASRPKLKEVVLKLNALGALGYATDKILKHAAVLGTLMLDAFAEELMFLTENAFFRGTGAGQPVGILNANALVTVTKETGQAAATLQFENITNMWQRMNARSRKNAVWFINQDTESQLFQMNQLIGTGGMPVYMPPGGLSATPYASLFGRPVVPIEYASTLGTVGDVVLADMSQYWMIDGGSPETASSIHVLFTTFEQAFRSLYYVDGASMWHSAVTPFQGSNTTSPFVALATRS